MADDDVPIAEEIVFLGPTYDALYSWLGDEEPTDKQVSWFNRLMEDRIRWLFTGNIGERTRIGVRYCHEDNVATMRNSLRLVHPDSPGSADNRRWAVTFDDLNDGGPQWRWLDRLRRQATLEEFTPLAREIFFIGPIVETLTEWLRVKEPNDEQVRWFRNLIKDRIHRVFAVNIDDDTWIALIDCPDSRVADTRRSLNLALPGDKDNLCWAVRFDDLDNGEPRQRWIDLLCSKAINPYI